MNTFKRYFCILLSLVMLLSCVPALAAEEASSYWDIWIENDGYGTLTIFSDGTAIMNYYDGTVTECEWAVTEEGAKFTTGQWWNSPMELLDENTLSVANGWLTFTREGAEKTEVELNPVPVGEEGAAFFGSWMLDTISLDGESYQAALFGMTMTLVFNEDGTVVSFQDEESETTVWSVENGAALVDGMALTINENDQLVLTEDGSEMIFVRGEGTQDAELSEEEQLASLLALMSQMSDGTSDLPEELQGFVGEWHMVYTATGGLTGDLRTMGVTCTLVLNGDGSGSIDFPSAEESTRYDDEGVVRFGESGMPMQLLDGIFLQYGTEQGGYMIFSQDADAVFDPATLTPTTTAASTETPSSAVTFSSNEEYLGKKFVATSFTMMGQVQDASILGAEYSLLFRENGTCDFVMAGMALSNLSWGLGQVSMGLNQVEAFSINYYGTMFNAIPTSIGFDMDYYGTMTLHFTLAE